MSGVLAAEHPTALGHHGFDERMAHTCAHRAAAGAPYHLGHRPADDHVVHDGGARLIAEEIFRQDRRRRAARQGHEVIVHEERPVGVCVEGHAQVVGLLPHEPDQILQVLRAERIGGVVRERSVGLQVQTCQRGRDPLENLLDDDPSHAIAGVDSDTKV